MFRFCVAPLIFISLIGVALAEDDWGTINQETTNQSQNLTRQCYSFEVEECLYQIWRDRNCGYGNGTGTFGYSMDEKAAETWTEFSLKFLKDYYTSDTVGEDVYLLIDDAGYVSTESVDFDNDSENFGRYCFIQETIKCFQSKSCDIQDHNEILDNLYSASKSAPKMIFHVVKHYIKEKFEQAKTFFKKTFFN